MRVHESERVSWASQLSLQTLVGAILYKTLFPLLRYLSLIFCGLVSIMVIRAVEFFKGVSDLSLDEIQKMRQTTSNLQSRKHFY